MTVERWTMHYQIIGLVQGDSERDAPALAVMAETVEEEAAQKLHDYYEARGIQTIVVKMEVQF